MKFRFYPTVFWGGYSLSALMSRGVLTEVDIITFVICFTVVMVRASNHDNCL
jgi:hypothetical protein